MATRKKKVLVTGVTEEQMNQAFADYAKASASVAKINAEIDLKVAKIREAKADELSMHNAEVERTFEILQSYAVENRDVLFTKKKSIDTAHGILGFRTGTPKLAKSKKYTWEGILDLVKTHLPTFVRTKSEINKEDLLKAYSDKNEAVLVKFPECNIFVEQDETFYVERKSEEI